MSAAYRINTTYSSSSWNSVARTQKRFLHRTPDHTYMSIWKKAQVDFIQQLKPTYSNSDWDAGFSFYHSPNLIEQILRTSLALKQKGFIPFLHAAPAGSRINIKFAEVIYPHAGDKYFAYLRPPTEKYKISNEKAWQQIPKIEIAEQKNELISMSYALTSGIRKLETAASWGFVNHFGKEQLHTLVDQNLSLLKSQSLQPQENAYFKASIINLIVRYNRLKIGRFLAIGIPPEKLEKYAYDSAPYNVPTGHNVLDIALNPEKYEASLMQLGSHFATLVISDETLDSSSGIVVIDATHRKEVDDFCGNESFVPLKEIEQYTGLVSPCETDFEKEQQKAREKLDDELDTLVYQFQHLEECAEQFVEIPQDYFTPWDVPPQMI